MPLRPRLAPLLALLASAAFAQPAPASGTTTIPPPLAGEIERIQRLLEEAPPEPQAHEAATSALALARVSEDATEAALEEADRLRAEAEQADAELAGIESGFRRPLQRVMEDWLARQPDRESLESLSRRQEELGARMGSLREAIAAADAALAALLPAATGELAEQHSRVEQRRAAAVAARAAMQSNGSLAARANNVAAEAALRQALAEMQRLEARQETLPTRQRLWEGRRRARERELAIAVQQAAYLAGRIEARRASLAESLRLRLRNEAEEYVDAPVALRSVAQENFAFGEKLLDLEGELAAARRQTGETARALQQAEESLRNTRTRLALGGSDEALGLLLLGERRRLADPAELERQLAAVRRRHATVQLDLIGLAEHAAALDDLPAAAEQRLRDADAEMPDDSTSDLRDGFRHLLGTRAELLPELIDTSRQLATTLDELDRLLQAQLQGTRALDAILDRQLLWIPSHAPAGRNWLLRHPAGWADLLAPTRLADAARRLATAAIEHWPRTLATLLLVGMILAWRRRLPTMLDAAAAPLRNVRDDSYRHTMRILMASLLAAAPAALLAHGLGWLLTQAGDPGKYSHSLGRAVLLCVPTLYLYSLLGTLGRERGLLSAHLRWSTGRRAALARLRPWLLWVLLPLQWLGGLAFLRNLDPALDTVGRDTLMATSLLFAWMGWKLLDPDGLWPGRRGAAAPVRRWLRVLVPAGLVALAGLALAGYLLTAGAILGGIWSTGLYLFAAALLHGLISRWLLLGERRIALRRYLARREAADAEERSAGGDGMRDIDGSQIDLQNVNVQTRRLLRALTLSLVALGLLWVWSDLLPALGRLDEIALWHTRDVDADGHAVRLSVSLQDLLLGLLALVLTFVAARNLPGLVEVGLISKTHADAPTRYAITSVSRYLIVTIGLLAGLSLLGLRWSQLQWMAAALTVGLGFGLQEIFANFVSGLILLFERPFRVGDVITIGELTGTVSRIRTRATTLVDFDNKEIVVPNKTFITGQLVNWTLTDTRTRVIVKVGVAYGSDVALVHSLLQQAAGEHPKVLDDPAPRSWFMAFGASTLDFELRVFVRQIEDRLHTLNDLNTRIAGLFAEHGIEIAFPQMDIHVRDLTPRAGEAPAER